MSALGAQSEIMPISTAARTQEVTASQRNSNGSQWCSSSAPKTVSRCGLLARFVLGSVFRRRTQGRSRPVVTRDSSETGRVVRAPRVAVERGGGGCVASGPLFHEKAIAMRHALVDA